MAPRTVAAKALVLLMAKALRWRFRSQIVAPMTAAPKTLVFSRPVALRSAVHDVSGSEVNCFQMPVTPKTVALKTLVF